MQKDTTAKTFQNIYKERTQYQAIVLNRYNFLNVICTTGEYEDDIIAIYLCLFDVISKQIAY